ncbi:hypothetical protein ONE63_003540 [Megalurothrips usitatus]|uniref:oleoyl-[acyl-carrier-protein] hydrolase n=1 Tax=Megalurothrips usitatus TaxID=439358 RepID=A0AAV7X3B5_9NEOP|nr:hypothetical protein ONE63_003540 [Megalurothrips usitatus]
MYGCLPQPGPSALSVLTALGAPQDDADEAVAALVSAALAAAPAVRLVVLSAQPGPQAAALRRLADLAAARASQGLSTACLAAPLSSAVSYLANLVCRAEPPPLTCLTAADAASGASVAEQPIAALPDSAAALAAVGRAAARCADGATLRAVPSLSLPRRCPSENSTVFALPPLGVLDPAAAEQLAGLAGRLLSPVVVVEAAVRASIHDTAMDVVKGVVSRQPRGPYNILGWGLAAVLALEVQRQLEAAGSRGVLFLVHGDVRAAVEWAKKAVPAREPTAKPETRRGAEAISRLLNAIANYECDLNRQFEWSVHIVGHSAIDRRSLNKKDSNVHLINMIEPGLDHASMASWVNENCVNHRHARSDDMRHAIASKRSAPKPCE